MKGCFEFRLRYRKRNDSLQLRVVFRLYPKHSIKNSVAKILIDKKQQCRNCIGLMFMNVKLIFHEFY